MKTENYERTNICRWVLLLLNLLFAFGTVFPVFEYDADDKANMWNICRKMRIYSSADLFDRSPFPSKEYFWQSVLLTALVILLLIIPILHVMKLLGLLGESRRNSRGLSLAFSVCVTIGIIVVPFLYYFVVAGGRSPLFMVIHLAWAVCGRHHFIGVTWANRTDF